MVLFSCDVFPYLSVLRGDFKLGIDGISLSFISGLTSIIFRFSMY